MSLLSDASIRKLLTQDRDGWEKDKRVSEDKLLIENFQEKSLTPVGYDLRIGPECLRIRKKLERINLPSKAVLKLEPGDIAVILTEEYIGMPRSKWYSGQLLSRVTIAEKGISHISTTLDPDWKGQLWITVTNLSKRSVEFRQGERLCTMMLFKNEAPSEKDCGKNTDGHFKKLVTYWEMKASRPGRERTWKLIKTGIPVIPLLFLVYKSLCLTISQAEVALGIAISSFLAVVADRSLPNE